MYKKTSKALQHSLEVNAPGKTGGLARGTLSLKERADINEPTLPIVTGGVFYDKTLNKTVSDTYRVSATIEPVTEGVDKLFDVIILNLFRSDANRHLISFRFRKFTEHEITTFNIFDFLEYMVFTFGVKSSKYSNTIVYQQVGDDTSLSITRAVNARLFTIETPEKRFKFTVAGRSRVFGISGWPVSQTHTVMYTMDNYPDNMALNMRTDGLYLAHKNNTIVAPKPELEYFIPFKQPLSPEESFVVNLNGTMSEIYPDRFIHPGEYKDQRKETQLVWQSLGRFEYLKSVDDKVFIMFVHLSGFHMLQELLTMLVDHDDLQLKLMKSVKELDLVYSAKTNDIKLTRLCLAFHSNFIN